MYVIKVILTLKKMLKYLDFVDLIVI